MVLIGKRDVKEEEQILLALLSEKPYLYRIDLCCKGAAIRLIKAGKIVMWNKAGRHKITSNTADKPRGSYVRKLSPDKAIKILTKTGIDKRIPQKLEHSHYCGTMCPVCRGTDIETIKEEKPHITRCCGECLSSWVDEVSISLCDLRVGNT